MKTKLFSDNQFDQMAREVCRVLFEIGYLVDHPEVEQKALRAGGRRSAAGRVLFTPQQVDALRARLIHQYPPPPAGRPEPDWIHPRKEFQSGLGNLTPKFYDYEQGQPEGGSAARLTELIQFAQSEPRVVQVIIPLSRQDVAPEIEQIDSLARMARLTNKPLGGIDVTIPEAVPFVAEMGQVLGQAPATFIGCCNCINPPLRLERRTAETMLRRARYHSRSMITPMPCLGGSAPVDIYGAVIQGTAEIVGGLILSMIIDPEAPLRGYIASTQVDMRSGNGTSCTPQTVRLDAGVYQLMEHAFGGGTAVGGRSYINARRPGLQAVFERFLKAVGYAPLVDGGALGYAGTGNLDNGSTFSPEQFLLDMEIGAGLDWLRTAPRVDSPSDAVERIQETVFGRNGNFLDAEHTLTRYREEMWDAAYFPCQTSTWTEKELLDRCHADYRRRVDGYQPAAQPDAVVKELDRIRTAAKRHLLSQ